MSNSLKRHKNVKFPFIPVLPAERSLSTKKETNKTLITYAFGDQKLEAGGIYNYLIAYSVIILISSSSSSTSSYYFWVCFVLFCFFLD